MEFDDILEEMKGVGKIAKAKADTNKARDIYIEQEIRLSGLTDADANEWRVLDRLKRLAEELISDLEEQTIRLLPAATREAYYKEKARLFDLHTQYLKKQGVILDNIKPLIKGGK